VTAHEAAKAANTFMSSLRDQPLSLALVVMNFALIGFVYVQGSIFNTQRAFSFGLLLWAIFAERDPAASSRSDGLITH